MIYLNILNICKLILVFDKKYFDENSVLEIFCIWMCGRVIIRFLKVVLKF